jgi:hypothetical protein
MSDSKTILELCRALPDSEPELRARRDEFNAAVSAVVFGQPSLGNAHVTYIDGEYDVWGAPFSGHSVLRPVRLGLCGCAGYDPEDGRLFGHATFCLEPIPNYMGDIKDAKAATDVMLAGGFSLRVDYTKGLWNVYLYWPNSKEVTWCAGSTEEIARAAVAYLDAVAIESASVSQ